MRYSLVLRRSVIVILALVAACSSGTGDQADGGAQLTLTLTNSPEGVRVVEYEIACEGGLSFDGLMNVIPDRDPPIWEAFVGLPAGICDIVLTALNEDGSALCSGSTSIEVIPNITVKANIELSCPGSGGAAVGNVDIDGRFSEIPVNVCPIIHHMGAIPSQLREGESTSNIQVRTTDPDMGPEPLSIMLSADRGTLTSPNATDSMFVCPTGGGQVEVTAVVTDGFPQCEQTQSVTVFCPAQGNACVGVDCADDNDCTADVCSDGVCSNPTIADGVACDGGSGSCTSGECVPNADPCDGVNCDDGDDCTADLCIDGSCSNLIVVDGSACANGSGSCQAGECVIPDGCDGVVCDDDNECTSDSCSDGVCSYDSAPDGQLCNGGAGSCEAGNCEASNACEGVNCNDGNECTADSCLAGSCVYTDVADGTSCAAGSGSCESGSCQAVDLCAGVNCDDDNFCTNDSCADGTCSNAPVANGTVCGVDSECQGGVCTFTGGGAPDPALSVGVVFCGDVEALAEYNYAVTGIFSPQAAFQVGVPTMVTFETIMDLNSSWPANNLGLTLAFGGEAGPFEFSYADYLWEITGATPAEVAQSVPSTPFDVDPDANSDQVLDDMKVSSGIQQVMLTPTGGPITIKLKEFSVRTANVQLYPSGIATAEVSTIVKDGEQDPSCDAEIGRAPAQFAAP